MAAIVGSIFQTTFAAISFAGAGFLFKAFDKSEYEDEVRRHDRALEKLSRAKEAYYERELKSRDRIQRLRQQLADANQDIESTNQLLDELRKVQSIESQGALSREPMLSDFYKEGSKMKDYQYIVSVGVGFRAGFILYKLV